MKAHWTFLLGTGILIAIVILSLSFLIAAGPSQDQRAKIDPKVLEETAKEGETTFWIILQKRADLRPARAIQERKARGRFVFERLNEVADASQGGLRSLLQKRKVDHEPFWIVNAIRVTAGRDVLEELAAQPEVEQIVADEAYEIPKPIPSEEQPRAQALEWNIDRIRAPLVWSTFGVRGEGIVVANIDTGVQFNHPALIAQYRGNQGGGSFDHNYNWFDPSNICGNPSLVPCDNDDHGTHTMGTMVGDDGDPGSNQIGAAPHARWIAAKGCETSFCSDSALLAAGQWVLAPTDLNGQNPRPDLRPHASTPSALCQ